jgi:hypothetical protein
MAIDGAIFTRADSVRRELRGMIRMNLTVVTFGRRKKRRADKQRWSKTSGRKGSRFSVRPDILCAAPGTLSLFSSLNNSFPQRNPFLWQYFLAAIGVVCLVSAGVMIADSEIPAI